jgi:hypothetical protein
MNFAKPVGSAEIVKLDGMEAEGNIRELARSSAGLRQAESSDGETSASSLSTLLRRVSETSMAEIDTLIGELQRLQKKLQADGNRVEQDIVEYSALSHQVMQLTKIISESVRKLPDAPRIGG